MRFFRDRAAAQAATDADSRPETEEEDLPERTPHPRSRPLSTPLAAPARSLGKPLDDEPAYEDPFAARARLRSRPARGPVRRRIWDLEGEGPQDADGDTPDGSAPDDPAAVLAALAEVEKDLADPIPSNRMPGDDSSPERSGPPPMGDLTYGAERRGYPDQGSGAAPMQEAAAGAVSDDHPSGPSGFSPPEATVAEARAQVARLAQQAGGGPSMQATPGGSSRTKTRVLGFQSRGLADGDPFARSPSAATSHPPTAGPAFPVGWIVVGDGPGRGGSFTLLSGVSSIGRGEDQAVRLDFGDTSISRQGHASIAFDDETEKFYLGHGGKSNLVRLNGRPVLSTEELSNGDVIRIGETSLRFVALCGEGFSWANGADTGAADDAEH